MGSTYATDGVLPVDGLPDGTRMLCTGPPMVGGRGLAYRFVAQGLDAGDAGLIVSTDRSGADVAAAVRRLAADPDAVERLGVVDATGQPADADVGPARVRRAGSPADLTGIGVGVAGIVETFRDDGVGSLRVVVDSLSSLLVYADLERVYRFAHVLTGRIEQLGAVGLFLLRSDTDDEGAARLGGLFDDRLELRTGDDGAEYRIRGSKRNTGWQRFEAAGTADGPTTDRPTSTQVEETEADGEETLPASLHDLIDRVTDVEETLTVCNYTGGEEPLATLREYFEGLAIDVVPAELSTDVPTDFAVLHRGPDHLATSPIQELYDAIRVADLDDGGPMVERKRPDVLRLAGRRRYTVSNGGKLEMIRISRLVEMRALEAGDGTLRAGFQRLDRLADEHGTRELYERIARSGVDVHLYGLPGEVPRSDLYTLHADERPELADSWFVVFDGGGSSARTGALVSEETAPEQYTGFWTYRPEVVAAADAYLQSTYRQTA